MSAEEKCEKDEKLCEPCGFKTFAETCEQLTQRQKAENILLCTTIKRDPTADPLQPECICKKTIKIDLKSLPPNPTECGCTEAMMYMSKDIDECTKREPCPPWAGFINCYCRSRPEN